MSLITLQKQKYFGINQTWKFRLDKNKEEGLHLLMKYLSYAELRTCMVVSKVWREMAIAELQSRHSIKILSEHHAKLVLQQFENPNFQVGKCSIIGISVENSLLQEMFPKMGNTLHLLQLQDLFDLNEIQLFRVLKLLPNLQYLSVTLASHDLMENHYNQDNHNKGHFKFPFLSGSSSPSTQAPTSIETTKNSQQSSRKQEMGGESNIFTYENILHLHFDLGPYITFQLSRIFQVFPNLIELAIANVMEEPRKHLKSRELHHNEHLYQNKVRHLSLRQYSTTSFTEKLVHTLMRLNMHLDKLMIIFHPPNKTHQVSSTLLRQFIESMEPSLKSLKLIQVEDNPSFWHDHSSIHGKSVPGLDGTYYWNFNYSSLNSISILPITLANLQILHIQKPLIINLAQVLNHYPHLKELDIQVSYGSNWQGMFPSKLEPHEKITRLKIDFIDSDSLSRLGYCFPALQTLQLSYCDKSLFYVLCDLIPYFNGSSNLVSCHQCHGTTEEFLVVKEERYDETFSKTTSRPEERDGVQGVVGNGSGNHNATDATSKMSNKGGDRGATSFVWNTLRTKLHPEHRQRKKYLFKNLALLKVKLCDHRPFEKFVFLQGLPDFDQGFRYGTGVFGEGEEDEVDDRRIGFCWDVSKWAKEKFTDFMPGATENEDECSSA